MSDLEKFEELYGFRGYREEQLEFVAEEPTGYYSEDEVREHIGKGKVFVPGPFCIYIYEIKGEEKI